MIEKLYIKYALGEDGYENYRAATQEEVAQYLFENGGVLMFLDRDLKAFPAKNETHTHQVIFWDHKRIPEEKSDDEIAVKNFSDFLNNLTGTPSASQLLEIVKTLRATAGGES